MQLFEKEKTINLIVTLKLGDKIPDMVIPLEMLKDVIKQSRLLEKQNKNKGRTYLSDIVHNL